MKPQVVLVALAVLAVVAALPLAESKGHGDRELASATSAWPCCDNCGSCTKSIPPQCRCMDASPRGCNPSCKNCVKSSAGGADVFRCDDLIVNFCERRCTPAA